MDVKMDEFEDKVCVLEESFEIDFDYEFDVAKYFDFTQLETPEKSADSELWFDSSQGYPPSPLLIQWDTGADDLVDSVSSSPWYKLHKAHSIGSDSVGSSVSSIGLGIKGQKLLKSKLRSTSQPSYPVSSRLLKPTASLLAKKNQYIDVRSTRVSGRLQKLQNPQKSPGEADATKRQKLEIGYLHKVAQLKHQTSFSHKSPKKAETTCMTSPHAKQKVTVPKEPDLATAQRALRQRFKNISQLSNNAKHSFPLRTRLSNENIQETLSAKNKTTLPFQEKIVRGGKITQGNRMPDNTRTNSNKTLEQEKYDQGYSFRAHPLNKKILSSKGDMGVFRNCKRETTVPREFNLSNCKKNSQNPPIELFSKLSLLPGNHPSSLLEEHPLQIQVLEKNESLPNMKENKNANAVSGKSTSCFGNGRKMIKDLRNHLTSSRNCTIH